YEDSEGMLSVDYNGFIPLLVDAYKELNAKVADQEKTIASLTETNRKLKGTASINDIDSEEAMVLMQNRPNPFKDSTEIRCHLPETVSDAFICIYDLNGRQQMRVSIADRGDVAVTVSGSSLQPGIYIYSLIADGREADTKRMILTE
ncbi:MAG: T9SS type A sorting domain-containing protein, partial [Muribaculaceae bacterium]|nr:T9SS type A sorting domain-containing protein [Muribaculaceae bacterium]